VALFPGVLALSLLRRTPVTSSLLAAVGYDEATQTLEAVFMPNKNGIAPVYRYQGITKQQYDKVMNPAEGESVGKNFVLIKKYHFGDRVALIHPDGSEEALEI
jgi:hypothetical protein